MRKLILTMLLASSVAVPAMAQDRDFGNRRERSTREAPNEQREATREARRAQRAERAADRPAPRQPEAVQQVAAPSQFERGGDRVTREQRRSDGGRTYRDVQRRTQVSPYAENGQVLSEQRDISGSRNRSVLGQVLEQNRQRGGQVVVNRDRDRDGRYDRRSGTNREWSNRWRYDRNYDWRRHRDRNRSIFRLGSYYDPYGSRYRRFSIGFSLFPSYYQSNFWLNDPWQYRLPPAYGPYRWVRYYDDALLVNIYTGQVVDVEHNFFW